MPNLRYAGCLQNLARTKLKLNRLNDAEVFFFFFSKLRGVGIGLGKMCVLLSPFFFWGVSREGGLRKKKRQDDSRLMRSERFRVSKKKLLTF